MKFDCIHHALKIQYRKLGFLIGRHPVWFIVLPLLFSIAMFTAVLKISFLRDLDSVFASKNGRAMRQKQILNTLYPVNTSYNFDISKLSDKRDFGAIIIVASDGGNMLRENMYLKVIEIDRIIREIEINGLNYSQLCARYGDNCDKNVIFELLDIPSIREMKKGHYFLKYPFGIDSITNKYTLTGYNLGGVRKDHQDYVKEAKAIRLLYFLDNSSDYKKQIAIKWEHKFLATAKDMKFDNISIFRLTAKCFENEIARVSLEAIPMAIVATVVIFVFSFMICLTNDIIKCKPLIGIFGVTSALISVGTAFGFVIYCGIQYSDLNTAIPFLMLGIGIDDTFVLLAAWRRTDSKQDVPIRMAQTYSEAAVSITITSVTNFLSFFIGIFSPFPCFHIFCIYAASSVFFTYVYQITFFGGWMAVSGYREKNKLHPFTFRPVKCTLDKHGHMVLNKLHFKYFIKETDFADWISRELFGKKIGGVLVRREAKAVIALMYIIYLCLAIWGCTQVRDGLQYEDIFPDNSYVAEYMTIHLKYMTEYAHRIHIVVTETLDYSNPVSQKNIEDVLSDLESSPYISNFTNCWLRTFLQFSKMNRFRFSFGAFDMTKKDEFLQAVRTFLNLPWGKMFVDDILFSDDGMDIVSSRFIVTSYMTTNSTMQEKLLQEVNNIVDKSSVALASHDVWFPFYEQIILVAKSSVISISIAIITMTLVIFAFLPHLGYALCVGFLVLSIQVGVLGYMTLWGVNRDIVSVMCLLMSVGFSVDYSAHMAYAYINSTKNNPEDRLKDALGIVGVAICQGFFSTLLGSMFLGVIPSAIMRMFFKIIFLVISFAMLHSVFLLPLFLSIFGSCCASLHRENKHTSLTYESVQTTACVRVNEEETK